MLYSIDIWSYYLFVRGKLGHQTWFRCTNNSLICLYVLYDECHLHVTFDFSNPSGSKRCPIAATVCPDSELDRQSECVGKPTSTCWQHFQSYHGPRWWSRAWTNDCGQGSFQGMENMSSLWIFFTFNHSCFPPILVSKHPYFRALFTLIPNAPLACPLGRGCSCGIWGVSSERGAEYGQWGETGRGPDLHEEQQSRHQR